jgi:hypothetical protein
MNLWNVPDSILYLGLLISCTVPLNFAMANGSQLADVRAALTEVGAA